MGSLTPQRSTPMRCLTKTSRSPRVRSFFSRFDVGGYHGAIFANSGFFEVKKKLRDYSKSECDKFLYLDDPNVKVKSLGNHARLQPRTTNSGTDRRACIE